MPAGRIPHPAPNIAVTYRPSLRSISAGPYCDRASPSHHVVSWPLSRTEVGPLIVQPTDLLGWQSSALAYSLTRGGLHGSFLVLTLPIGNRFIRQPVDFFPFLNRDAAVNLDDAAVLVLDLA